jgi:hypothetical protein
MEGYEHSAATYNRGMSEEKMIKLAQAALDDNGVDDTIEAVGEFAPRGKSGSEWLTGGLLGGLGDVGGSVAGDIGFVAGMAAGSEASSEARGLPPTMLVGVSETTVYGMRTRSRRTEPDRIVFAVPREGLTAKVHQRLDVRVLELIHEDAGSSIELEGSRLPMTHSKDVMDILRQAGPRESASPEADRGPREG